ncbi:MAG: hypothetical protein ACLPX5_12945 [Dissulfurispiraceae bacterium]
MINPTTSLLVSLAEMKLLYHMLNPVKIEKTGLGEKATAFSQIANQRRVNAGQSTQNISVAIRLEDLVMMKEAREREQGKSSP